MHLYGIHIALVIVLLVGTAAVEYGRVNDNDIESVGVIDALKRMDKKIGVMETRLESVERELKEQKEVNVKLTVEVADLKHKLSSGKQKPTCSQCRKKSSISKENTNFRKIAQYLEQPIEPNQPLRENTYQWKMIRMMVQAWQKHGERITALETSCSQTTLTSIVQDDTPGADNGGQERFKKDDKSKPRRTLGADVAFTAYLDHEINNIGAGRVIQMRGVVLNEGGGYNSYTGIFTTPQSGVYLFSFTIEHYHHDQLIVNLVVDGIAKVSSVNNSPSNVSQQSGNLAIVRLNTGQSVWLATARPAVAIYGSPEYRYTTFSGAFLYT